MSAPVDYIVPFSPRGLWYTEEDIAAVVEVMKHAEMLTQGKYMREFEQNFSTYLGGEVQSFALSSCAAALELAAALTEVGPGDEVVIPSHTYCASAIPFARRGVKIVWADIDPDTRVVSAETIAAKLSPKTKVVVVVHLYGLAVPMNEIMKLAEEREILVVEDCAQAIGAASNGRRVGSIGHFGCFSLHSQKNITTLGEGGLLSVKSPELAKLVPMLRLNGHRPYPSDRKRYWLPAMVDVDSPMDGVWPFKYTIGEAQCALGTSMLKRLDEINARRYKLARMVIDSLKSYPELSFQSIPKGSTHVYHLLSARYDGQRYGKNRDDLIELLAFKHKIQAIVQYYPLNRYPLFVKAGFGQADCPNTDHFFDNMLSLPFFPWFSEKQFDYLIEKVKESLEELRKNKGI